MKESTGSDGISPLALGAAFLTAALWGFNFTVIKVGVAGVPPLFLACLRFALSAFPALLFVKKPNVSWASLAAYGLLLGVGQFGLLFTAMKLGAPAGLSSIILQAQAFFTAIIAAIALKEKVRAHNVIGMAVAAIGLFLIARSGNGSSSPVIPLPLVAMVLLSAVFWASANIVAKKMPKTDGLGLVVWSSLFSPLPLLCLSFAFEGTEKIYTAVTRLSPVSVGALAYLVIASTLFGYGVWNQLIMRHGATKIAPFSLLVPVFGVSSAALVLGERFGPWEAAAALLVLSGLVVHVFGGRISAVTPRRRPGP
ncbi:MAG: EamA family transporter [Treponemataceae bacterium]